MTRPLNRSIEPFALQTSPASKAGFGSEQELWRRMALPQDDPEFLPSYLIGGLRLIKVADLKQIFDRPPDPFKLAAKRLRGMVVVEHDPQLLDAGFDEMSTPEIAEAG
jgi:hypothetical protein